MQRQQVPERVHRGMYLRPLRPLVAVVPGPPAALRGGPQGPAVKDGGRRFGVATGGEPQDGAEVVDDRLEASCGEPATGLLVDHLPGGEVLGQVAPGGAATDEPPGGIEDVAEVVDALTCVLGEEAEIGNDELPFGVRDVTGVRLVCSHTLNYVHNWTKVHNTL